MEARLRKVFGVVLAGVVVAACAEGRSPVDQGERPGVEGSASVVQVPTLLPVLKRVDPLKAAVKASAVIDPAGGVLELPEAGLRVVFPVGAVASPVWVSVQAPAGRNVAYRFSPHGMVFLKPVRVEQSLVGTEAEGNAALQLLLRGGYFPLRLDHAARLDWLPVTEVYPVFYLDEARTRAAFYILHFSGYMMASG